MTPDRYSLGVSRLELLIVLIVLLIAGGFMLDRINREQETVERFAMDTTLKLYRMALQMRLAELISANREGEARRLEVENPTALMSTPPAGYVGEYRNPPEKGAWYFDSPRRELVYVPNLTRGLDAEEIDGVKQIRFKIRLQYQELKVSGGRAITGISLQTVTKYQWSCIRHSPILVQNSLKYQRHARHFS